MMLKFMKVAGTDKKTIEKRNSISTIFIHY
jgi:hypothetical protein